MKKLTLALLLLISGMILSAQDEQGFSNLKFSNSLNVSVSGDADAPAVSIIYERFVAVNNKGFLAFGTGIGIGIDNTEEQSIVDLLGIFTTVPFNVTYNMGQDRHFFEFGLKVAFIRKDDSNDYLVYPKIGYRLMYERFNLKIMVMLNSKNLGVRDVSLLHPGLHFGVAF